MRWTPKEYDPIYKWFAWHPVKLYGSKQRVWWEWVYRTDINTPYGGFSVYGLTREQADYYNYTGAKK